MTAARFVLPADVSVVAVADLRASDRDAIPHAPTDFAVTRAFARTPSRIIDESAAALLREFASPIAVAEAVLRFSRAREVDPERVLEDAYPLLAALMRAGVLVPESDAGIGPVRPMIRRGDEIEGWRAVALVQLLEDCEVHQVRRGAEVGALKVARSATSSANDRLSREVVLLGAATPVAPALLQWGATDDGRHYIVMEWCGGVDAATAALGHRLSGDRAALIALCRAIADAYATVHERGVLHGDVHPRNVLVDAATSVRLVDFGLARRAGQDENVERGGVAFYYEPELAAAFRERQPAPPVTSAGEQYAVAAMLYELLTGARYLDFSLEREELLRQIACDAPLSFAQRGVAPAPAIERALRRALGKSPQGRYSSMRELAESLHDETIAPAIITPKLDVTARLDRWTRSIAPGGDRHERGLAIHDPSVQSGAAGVALAALHAALAREDGALLALADHWSSIAMAMLASGRPLESPAAGQFGPTSLWHAAPGVHFVAALVAEARGDAPGREEAIHAFIEAAAVPAREPDLTTGNAGGLLGASTLLAIAGRSSSALETLGDDLLRTLWVPPGSDETRVVLDLAIAHGWAGQLYATLRWSAATGAPIPDAVGPALGRLEDEALRWGRGVRWPCRDAALAASWCNGSAGMVHLWTLAHALLREPRYGELAERAAWSTWDGESSDPALCCGLSGQAYALLALYRHTGDDAWLQRARVLAQRALEKNIAAETRADSFYQGESGVIALACDLEQPECASMPLFGNAHSSSRIGPRLAR